MIRRVLAAALVTAVLAAGPGLAQAARHGDLTLDAREVRASLGTNPNTAGYLTIDNGGAKADRLVGASCACAREVQLHLMTTRGGIMKMEKADALVIPAGRRLSLAPGGAHLMLLGLKQPLKAGDKVRMTLRFKTAGEVTTDFHVVAQPGDSARPAHRGH